MKHLILMACMVALAFFTVLTMTSCSGAPLKERMDHRVGRPIDDVVLAQGEPTKVEKLSSGSLIYVWDHQQKTKDGTLKCVIKYLVDEDGYVRSWHHEGNWCE